MPSENIIDLGPDRVPDIQKVTGFDIQIWPISSPIPSGVKEIPAEDFGCKDKYSYTIKEKYFANLCYHCSAL